MFTHHSKEMYVMVEALTEVVSGRKSNDQYLHRTEASDGSSGIDHSLSTPPDCSSLGLFFAGQKRTRDEQGNSTHSPRQQVQKLQEGNGNSSSLISG